MFVAFFHYSTLFYRYLCWWDNNGSVDHDLILPLPRPYFTAREDREHGGTRACWTMQRNRKHHNTAWSCEIFFQMSVYCCPHVQGHHLSRRTFKLYTIIQRAIFPAPTADQLLGGDCLRLSANFNHASYFSPIHRTWHLYSLGWVFLDDIDFNRLVTLTLPMCPRMALAEHGFTNTFGFMLP